MSLQELWSTFQLAGMVMIPLSVLAVLAFAVILEKAWLYLRYARLPAEVLELVETYNFDWSGLGKCLQVLPDLNCFGRFFRVILDNRQHPVWWVESRAADEAQQIEQVLAARLWILETVVTAAPLLGLLGTILGMMHAFHLIGNQGLVNPAGVTGGVAQALIATAVGLLIALCSLFGFNFFSRLQTRTLDEMERLGTRVIDHVRLDQQERS